MLDARTLRVIVDTAELSFPAEHEPRNRLLFGFPPQITSQLAEHETWRTQLMSDLGTLNRFDKPVENSLPIVIWLENAARETSNNPDISAQFERWARQAELLVSARVRPPSAPVIRAGSLPVLLARVSDDLEPRRQQLRDQLNQSGVRTLPVQEFEDGAPFRAEFASALAEAQIVVQLLGRVHSRRTASFPEGYDQFQAAQANASNAALVQWRDVEIEPEHVVDANHRDLLWGGSVEAMSFPDFAEMIVRRASPPSVVTAPVAGGRPFIFVDSTKADAARAHEIVLACRRMNIGVFMPDFDSDTKDDYRENYAKAHRVALVWEKSPPGWIGSQLRYYVKSAVDRSRDRGCVIHCGPPAPKLAEELAVSHPEFVYVDATSDGKLDRFLIELFGKPLV